MGKTYRMLQEPHTLLRNGIDVKIGFVETHNRPETVALVEGLPVIPRRKLFYKGRELEEMGLQAIINLRPEVVIVDELAHSNIEGSKNAKRWQDVLEILEAGVNVISAVNIQHTAREVILKENPDRYFQVPGSQKTGTAWLLVKSLSKPRAARLVWRVSWEWGVNFIFGWESDNSTAFPNPSAARAGRSAAPARLPHHFYPARRLFHRIVPVFSGRNTC